MKRKKQTQSKKLKPLPARGSAFITRREAQRNQRVFLGALDRAIEFHRTNTNDPHNIGNAVMVAITEVRDAFKAYMCDGNQRPGDAEATNATRATQPGSLK